MATIRENKLKNKIECLNHRIEDFKNHIKIIEKQKNHFDQIFRDVYKNKIIKGQNPNNFKYESWGVIETLFFAEKLNTTDYKKIKYRGGASGAYKAVSNLKESGLWRGKKRHSEMWTEHTFSNDNLTGFILSILCGMKLLKYEGEKNNSWLFSFDHPFRWEDDDGWDEAVDDVED